MLNKHKKRSITLHKEDPTKTEKIAKEKKL